MDKITKVSTDTALGDITDLVNKDVLFKTDSGAGSKRRPESNSSLSIYCPT
ncbi:MAG: hypothetical protein LBF27_19285 [Sphingobacterium sp.]|jgi:Fic family protein|nr:hypothetical protein [Sphingobacterium sp.]